MLGKLIDWLMKLGGVDSDSVALAIVLRLEYVSREGSVKKAWNLKVGLACARTQKPPARCACTVTPSLATPIPPIIIHHLDPIRRAGEAALQTQPHKPPPPCWAAGRGRLGKGLCTSPARWCPHALPHTPAPHISNTCAQNKCSKCHCIGHNATNHTPQIDAFLVAAGLTGNVEDANGLIEASEDSSWW